MSTLKWLLVVVLTVLAVGVNAKADSTNIWVPSGYVKGSVSSKAINPRASVMYYDESYASLDMGINLPGGFMVEVNQNADLVDSDLDSKGVDESDVFVWKAFDLGSGAYVRYQLAYRDGFPISKTDGDDTLGYDVYLGRKMDAKDLDSQLFSGAPTKLTFEMRAEYWHFIKDFSEGMVSIMPSVKIDCPINSTLSVYEKIGLQWNDAMASFGQLLSGQLDLGVNKQLTKNLSWNIVDVMGIMPFGQVQADDPRSESGAVAIGTCLLRNF